MQTTNSTINITKPQFSHCIVSLADSWSFTITFISLIMDHMTGVCCFIPHPLDFSLISALAVGNRSKSSEDIPPWVHPMLFCYSFSEPAPRLCKILSPHTNGLEVLKSQHHWEQPSTNWEGRCWIKPQPHSTGQAILEALYAFWVILKLLLPIVATSIAYCFLLPCLFSYTSRSHTVASWFHFPNKLPVVRPQSQDLLSEDFNIKLTCLSGVNIVWLCTKQQTPMFYINYPLTITLCHFYFAHHGVWFCPWIMVTVKEELLQDRTRNTYRDKAWRLWVLC